MSRSTTEALTAVNASGPSEQAEPRAAAWGSAPTPHPAATTMLELQRSSSDPIEEPSDAGEETRVPPMALHSEDAVVGCLVANPTAVIRTLLDFSFDPADMCQPFHRQVIRTALDIGTPLDICLLAQRMPHTYALPRLHALLLEPTWSISTLDRHLREITITAQRRRVIETAAELTEAAYDAADLRDSLTRVVVAVESVGAPHSPT